MRFESLIDETSLQRRSAGFPLRLPVVTGEFPAIGLARQFRYHPAIAFKYFWPSPLLAPEGCLGRTVLIKTGVKPQFFMAIHFLKLPDHIVK